MLSVSGFSSVVRAFNNKNTSINNNPRPVVFQSGTDVVSFKAVSSEVKKDADKKLEKLIKIISEKYPDVLENNFKKAFLEPLEEFLKENNVSIKTQNISNNLETSRSMLWESGDVISNSEVIKDVFSAILTNKKGNSIFTYADDCVHGLTKNESKLYLFSKYVYGCLEYLPDDSFLRDIDCPKKLSIATNKIYSALEEFYRRWGETEIANRDLKTRYYQKGVSILMPEVK